MSFNEWNEVKLIDICDLISRGVSPSYTEDKNEGIVVINQKCIRDNCINLELARLTNPIKKKITDTKYLKKYDILVNSTGVGTLGRVAQVKNLSEKMTVDSHVTIVRANSHVNPVFLGYNLFMQQRFIEYLGEGSTGQTELSRVRLGEALKLKLPPIEEQKAIAKILSDLDNKIEVNNKINQRLEDMAQSIFKHWFVDFEFPNEEGKPYKSSGGEMVESELGMIPKGWEVKTIGKLPVTVTDYVANGSFKSLKDNVTIYEENNYALFIRNTDLKCKFSSSKRFVDEHSYNFLSKSRLYGGEIIISNVGDVGSVYTCPLFNMPMTLGNNVIMIDTDKNEIDLNKYIFRFFKSVLGQHLISGITGGSAQPKFNKTDFRSIKLAIPNEKILTDYNNAIKGIENKILHNDKQNDKVSSLRDTLLPKLMSGEIRVSIDK